MDRRYERAKADSTRFSEAGVEECFGITVSKLRTAQRFKLVEPEYGVSSERRITRSWTITEIARVWVCNQIAHFLNVPFIAAVNIMLEWDKVTNYKREDTIQKRLDPRHKHPMIEMTDRRWIAMRDGKKFVYVGCIETGDDGRQRLLPEGDATVAIPGERERSSFCTVNLNVVRDRFLVLYDTVSNSS